MSISIRRHHSRRMKEKFRRLQKANRVGLTSKRAAGIFANHGRTCSCFVCSGSRRFRGETIQEKRSKIALNEIEYNEDPVLQMNN